MQHLLTPYNKNREFFAWWENAFNDDELNFLQQQARTKSEIALVGGGDSGGNVPEIRRSEVTWMNSNENTKWVFERLAHVVSALNSQFFFFDLIGFGEAIQLTNYDETNKGVYGWHVDFGSNTTTPSRKLSLVLQLSDPVDYEGGVLELQPYGKEIIKMRKQRGLIICFPSWTLHQVTPVTQGSRQTLVSWITGPSFV